MWAPKFRADPKNPTVFFFWTKRKRPKNIENWLLAKHAKTTWELKSWKWVTLPETNILHLKMDGWKSGFLLGWLPGRCYVSFRERTFCEKASMCHVSIRLSRANVIRPNFGFLPVLWRCAMHKLGDAEKCWSILGQNSRKYQKTAQKKMWWIEFVAEITPTSCPPHNGWSFSNTSNDFEINVPCSSWWIQLRIGWRGLPIIFLRDR